ncbi:sulfatase [Engelhardtia mirabilis]|uniref:Arylsulfatase n=1 Tax=Engelhardtia mirabilis TaxID=2528011 RepID=A0A518BK65_9BACT|nr:Arylsulfatase [Planctomycetes bacterium Pla133]QDV01693.1 Arylsulfatase [Planctomycetes bacterium Pla86]
MSSPRTAAPPPGALGPRLLAGAIALALAGCGGAEQVEYREVALELLRSPERLEVRREPARYPVRIQAVSPLRSVGSGSGNRPALVLPPGSEVAWDLPALGPGTELVLEVGVAWRDHEEARGRATMVGLLNGEPIFEDELVIGGVDVGRRGWIEHRVAAPDGGELVLRCTSPELKGLRTAVAGLTLEQRHVVEAARSSPAAPNLVLIVIDTLRADRVSAYGYERPTAPAMEALAARGVLWEDAWSVAPWTWPSTASILTGQEPPAHGVLDRFSCYLPDASQTLAERLRAAGFDTAGWSSNPLISAEQNFAQGFARFETEDWTRSAQFVEAPLAWLEGARDRRFLLYLHLTDPHLPYQPESELRARFASAPIPEGFEIDDLAEDLRARVGEPEWVRAAIDHASDLYDAEVAASDRAVARVVEQLEQLGLTDSTLVIVTSDHGEELLEHGLLGHSHQLFRESLIVPLIAAGPGLPAGVRVDSAVQNHRLLPSILTWLHLQPSGGLPPILPLANESRPPTLRFGTEVGDWMATGTSERLLARRADGELVLWMESGERLAIFDTKRDPAETVDLLPARRADAERGRADLQGWWQRQSSGRPVSLAGGEATAEMLRALGYLEDDE